MLDFLAGIGGLYGSISPLCFGIVMLLQYRSTYQFVMADMFVERKSDNDQLIGSEFQTQKTMDRHVKKNDVQWNTCRAMLLNMQVYIPEKL